jgi:plastocyanin
MKRNILMVFLFSVIVFSVTALSLTGCTGAVSGTTIEATGPIVTHETNPASKNEILIESNTFKPDTITIKAGDVITWVNKDSYAHTVKAVNGEFDSGNIASGAEFSFTFNKEGTIDYICGIHTFMKGTIIVTK